MYKAEGCKNHKLSYMNKTIISRKREWSARCFSAHTNSKSTLNGSHRIAATFGMLAESKQRVSSIDLYHIGDPC